MLTCGQTTTNTECDAAAHIFSWVSWFTSHTLMGRHTQITAVGWMMMCVFKTRKQVLTLSPLTPAAPLSPLPPCVGLKGFHCSFILSLTEKKGFLLFFFP